MSTSFDIDKKHFKVEKIVYYDKVSKWGVLATKPMFTLAGKTAELLNCMELIPC